MSEVPETAALVSSGRVFTKLNNVPFEVDRLTRAKPSRAPFLALWFHMTTKRCDAFSGRCETRHREEGLDVTVVSRAGRFGWCGFPRELVDHQFILRRFQYDDGVVGDF